jgi:hypothetical protein
MQVACANIPVKASVVFSECVERKGSCGDAKLLDESSKRCTTTGAFWKGRKSPNAAPAGRALAAVRGEEPENGWSVIH